MYENVKRFLIHIVLLLGGIDGCFAQRMESRTFTASDYTTDTLQMEDYTYICDTLKHTRITLRNITDHPGREELCYSDGTPLESELATSRWIDALVMSESRNRHLHNIVDEAFSQMQAESLDGRPLHIVLNISSSSGEITDVYFNYLAYDGYADIPIEVYRNMELRFKNEIFFELTDLGRKLNYCLLSWRQCPRGREESGLEVPEDGEKLTMPDGKLGDAVGSLGGSIGLP